MISQSRTSYNPKAHSPAVYIPCWLIQVPSSELSHQAKILYGRLAQWSSSKGVVHRSVPQLSQETGMCISTVKRTIKELKDCLLIDTYQKDIGGVNYYQFFEHSWMSAPINKNLEYNNPAPQSTSDTTPGSDVDLPRSRCGAPKIKEIKRNKNRATRAIKSVDKIEDTDSENDSKPSGFFKKLPKNFKPDAKSMNELLIHSARVKISSEELLKKFQTKCNEYGKKSSDWQKSFIEFIQREKTSGKKTEEKRSMVQFFKSEHESKTLKDRSH